MENIRLSIIMPVYNTKKYLPASLESILAAGLPSAELILVDDGSADGSLEICRRYAAKLPCIRLICQQQAGPSAARNRGLDAASGEYVIFFDSDDYIRPDAFRKTVSMLDRHPEAECWVSDFCRVAENGYILDRVYQIADTSVPISDCAYLRRFLQAPGCVWNIWRYIFRRDFLLRHGLRFCEQARCAEDLEFIIRVLSTAQRIAFFHNPYYFYRVNYGPTLTRAYTANRVRQLTEMLQLSAHDLRTRKGPSAQLLLDKLVLEYLLNLALLWEVPAAERADVRFLLDASHWLIALPEAWPLKLAGRVVSLLGTAPSAWLLHQLKQVKRRIRKFKTSVYQNRLEWKTEHGDQSIGNHSGL